MSIKALFRKLKSLLGRVPRRMWQLGLDWGNGDIQWGYIMPVYDQEVVDAERECENDVPCICKVVLRRCWVSYAKLETLPEFGGW
ncbi:MAG: hypothetical protein ABFD54_11350 [Armatimonadota bacterium]